MQDDHLAIVEEEEAKAIVKYVLVLAFDEGMGGISLSHSLILFFSNPLLSSS